MPILYVTTYIVNTTILFNSNTDTITRGSTNTTYISMRAISELATSLKMFAFYVSLVTLVDMKEAISFIDNSISYMTSAYQSSSCCSSSSSSSRSIAINYIRAAYTFRSYLNIQIGPYHNAVHNYGNILYYDTTSSYNDIVRQREQWQRQRLSLDIENYDGDSTKKRYTTHILTIATDSKHELETLASTATISGISISIIGLNRTWDDYSCKLRWYFIITILLIL